MTAEEVAEEVQALRQAIALMKAAGHTRLPVRFETIEKLIRLVEPAVQPGR